MARDRTCPGASRCRQGALDALRHGLSNALKRPVHEAEGELGVTLHVGCDLRKVASTKPADPARCLLGHWSSGCVGLLLAQGGTMRGIGTDWHTSAAAVALLAALAGGCGTSHEDASEGATSGGAAAGTAQGGGTQGGATQGGASQGGASQGGASQGGASQGGATQGGTTQGGATQGGATQTGPLCPTPVQQPDNAAACPQTDPAGHSCTFENLLCFYASSTQLICPPSAIASERCCNGNWVFSLAGPPSACPETASGDGGAAGADQSGAGGAP
jgi:hypothetical protein